jgi:hypothetical protein
MSWPLLILTMKERMLSRLLLSLVALSLTLRIPGHELGAPLKFVHNFTLCRLDGIALGSFAALWLRASGVLKSEYVADPRLDKLGAGTSFMLSVKCAVAWPTIFFHNELGPH